MSGPVKIAIASADEINRIPVAKKTVRELVENVLEGEGVTHADLSLVFVGSERMQELNSRFLDHDFPTDVLAFPFEEAADYPDGEIYVCIDTAVEQAREYRVGVKEELVRLVIHGVLHLIGYDDRTAAERERMLDRGEKYVKEFHKIAK